jgi:hypothetical protein
VALFAEGQRPTRLFALSARARAFLDLQAELGFRPGSPLPAERLARLSPETASKLREMALFVGSPGQGFVAAVVEGRWEGELTEADGVSRPVVVELRTSGGRPTGTMSTAGGTVSMAMPLQDVVVQPRSIRFGLRKGGSLRVFMGALDGSSISGEIHDGSAEGPAIGRLALQFVRGPG